MLTSGVFGYVADYLLWWVLLLSLVANTWCFFKLFPSDKHRKSGLILGNGLVFLCFLGVIAMAGETYLRFTVVETDSFGVSLPARRWFALYTEKNTMGCRDYEWAVEKPAGVRRVAFVGDSFTYGWGIKRVQDRFSDIVGERFAELSPGSVEVMNVAKPGWGSSDQLAPIRDLINRYAVDEIVLCYVFNDIEKLIPTTDDYDPKRPPEPGFFDPDRSCLVDYFYRTIIVPRLPTVRGHHDWLASAYADEGIWRRHQRQLGDITRVCADNEVTFRVVLLPFIQTGGERLIPERLHEVVRRFFEANNVEVVDLLPTILGQDPRELVVNARDPHPNETAHRLFAEAIWQAFYATPIPARTSKP